MKIVMDADCLIKLTKAGLKELVCDMWEVHIPDLVRRETTRAAPRLPDAVRIKENIGAGRILVASGSTRSRKGEEAALALFKAGALEAIATDDARFIRRLRGLGVPLIVPGVLIVKLCLEGAMTRDGASRALQELAPLISADERAAAELMLTGGYES